MDKTVLGIGGAGFIGSNFTYMLLEDRPYWKIVCVDILTYVANFHALNEAICYYQLLLKQLRILPVSGEADSVDAQ